ncbi:histidyl-tRNA synthetase [Lutibacter sp. Hel_I_33_5]|uniref:histidine--tRNA ligase n=1 Tax=Lutibacter sp. Hel_I_33_5 TaxID=1566289 RepID=UPI0011A54790|nr:histidine--tRNA ligase [Lutibacter sp. Hel_I_33_5]TVZ55432.1 histidyl-tRNA synthetase [Lutibacter sp. Hel_I_33_5]
MKPSIPKGTRDFSPTEVAKRSYIFNTIRSAFELFGFQPIETPSFENSSTLMGKYGEEGDRLIFKILNSGDYLKDVRNDIIESTRSNINFYSFFDIFIHSIDNINNKSEYFDKVLERYFNIINSADKIQLFVLDYFKKNKTQFFEKIKEIESVEESRRIVEINKYRNDLFLLFFDEYLSEYKILNSNKTVSQISEKALRYDLTVPFARYVVQHQNDISFPFKRYQIQPVWRADRPQKGRFREFYQCDADVVGSKSLLQEVEFIQLYDAVFSKLGLAGTTIKINNRKILSGIAEVIGAKDKLIDFTVALDKLDKIGKDGVVTEMLSKGITQEAIEKVDPLFSFSGSNLENIRSLENLLQGSEEGLKGVEELRFVINAISDLGLETASLEVDVTLARGLNYYTGAIFEVAAPKGVKMGSIGGGGRYDDLTGIFGLKDVSGVGISFGLDRIYLVLEELGLLQSVELPKPKVLFLNFDASTDIIKLKAIQSLREKGVKCELYPDLATSNKQEKKQWKYATNRKIEFVVSKIENDIFTIKDMTNFEQSTLSINEIIEKVK